MSFNQIPASVHGQTYRGWGISTEASWHAKYESLRKRLVAVENERDALRKQLENVYGHCSSKLQMWNGSTDTYLPLINLFSRL